MTGSNRADFFRNVIAMAPMAMGGNLPYRRLCREYGAVNTCSEMVLADKLLKGGERPLLRHHESEVDFGVQLTGKRPEGMADAAVLAAESGARFIDLNFGCPIDVIVRRGAGAALLKRPGKLTEIIAAVRSAVNIPLSVKLRLGYTAKKLNCVSLALAARDAGADAVCIHGRTRAQRYRLSADWTLIDEAARTLDIPVIGNGDILTPWDLRRRREETSVSSFLVARGALIKPWIFQELKSGSAHEISVPERWSIMRRYLDFALEHFGDDERGLGRAHRFFLWHLKFWCRYYPWSEEDFNLQYPDSLLQARTPQAGPAADERLLASGDESDHEVIWRRVLDRDYENG
ncbi:MAG: tRNA-dihydrouridine synthase family protein [Gemmatimonadales bacterium]|nr:tRNA-dihydrouridine synthase family protein [Gemmatimonadales bacterium]